jgi:predicted kinase
MPELILILTMGLPRSGKSTWAMKQGYPIVNRDAIRLALHGQAFIGEAEAMVTAIEEYMVKSLFKAGHKYVIVDATHLKEKYRKRWSYGPWELQIQTFDTPMDVCIERAKKDNREDLIPIIERMAGGMDDFIAAMNAEWDNRQSQ